MNEKNIISVSGGKDSTALLLLAIERETPDLEAVFADTGHEHPSTYEYVQYLNDKVFPIRTVRADFAKQIAGKARFVAEKWKPSLMTGKPGKWTLQANDQDGDASDGKASPAPMPPIPENPYISYRIEDFILASAAVWEWTPAVRPMDEAEADAWVQRALDALKPTGIPFLDLCIWKGRFPSTRARFCSEELKRNPIIAQVQRPLLEAGIDVVSWQGVRRDESINRRSLPERECKEIDAASGAELWNYRPILDWTVDDVFAMHRKHGIEPNPLYKQGMGRVGCMPCIHARKDELLEVSKRFPAEIERVAEWERIVSLAAKRGCSTFFEADTVPGNSRDMVEIRHDTHGIWQAVEWAKTGRGGRQFDMFRIEGEQSGALCTSIYGLCE
jgi:3'-phosphoadenosine 5'-phosphosulfate sulfotransferase (PAPS reductase)/FAD synthetase